MHNNDTRAFRALRLRVMERDDWTCKECGFIDETRSSPQMHADHIVSKDEGRALGWSPEEIDDESNLRATCAPCNQSKSNKRAGGREEYWNPLYAQYR